MSTADKAEKKRKQMIREIEACTCEWPVVVFRNMHGHGPGCPAVALWERHRQENDE